MKTTPNSNILLSILTLLVVVGAVSFYFLHAKNSSVTNQNVSINTLPVNTATTSDDMSSWQTYSNTAFGYSINYPSNGSVQRIADEERATTSESSAVEIFTPGSSVLGIRIIVWEKYSEKINAEFPEHNQLLALDLESFAKKIRQNDLDDKNPNFPNKKISELEESKFAGEHAYGFIVSGSMDGYGHSDYYRMFTEHNGVRFEIQYPKDELTAQRVIKTFSFVR